MMELKSKYHGRPFSQDAQPESARLMPFRLAAPVYQVYQAPDVTEQMSSRPLLAGSEDPLSTGQHPLSTGQESSAAAATASSSVSENASQDDRKLGAVSQLKSAVHMPPICQQSSDPASTSFILNASRKYEAVSQLKSPAAQLMESMPICQQSSAGPARTSLTTASASSSSKYGAVSQLQSTAQVESMPAACRKSCTPVSAAAANVSQDDRKLGAVVSSQHKSLESMPTRQQSCTPISMTLAAASQGQLKSTAQLESLPQSCTPIGMAANHAPQDDRKLGAVVSSQLKLEHTSESVATSQQNSTPYSHMTPAARVTERSQKQPKCGDRRDGFSTLKRFIFLTLGMPNTPNITWKVQRASSKLLHYKPVVAALIVLLSPVHTYVACLAIPFYMLLFMWGIAIFVIASKRNT